MIPGTVSGFTATKFTGTFNLIGSPAGLYNLTVTNPGGTNSTRSKIYTVRASGTDPIIGTFTPTTGVNTAAIPFMINGTDFRTGATVTITNGTTSKTALRTLAGTTKITCSLPLTGIQIEVYDLTVRNTDGSSAIRTGAFTVTNPAPTVTTVSPVSGYNTGSVPITISGTKFCTGASILLTNGSTVVSGSVRSLSATSITGSFQVTGLNQGIYNLTVSNPGDMNGTKQNGFTVLTPGNAPVITAINPSSGFNNAKLPVTITGANFRTPTVYLNQGSVLKLTTATAGKTSTTTTLYFTLPLTGISGGLYNITVRNSDGVNTTVPEIFSVKDQAWISSTEHSDQNTGCTDYRSPEERKYGLIPDCRLSADHKVLAGGGDR